MSATEAQNNFGRVLDRASSEGAVYITRYDRPTAVLLSVERYHELVGDDAPDLDALAHEFDEMLDRMRSPGAAAGFDTLFEMEPSELGDAAVRGARGDGD